MSGKYIVGRIPKDEEPDTVLIGCNASFFARVVGRPGHPAEPLALTMVEALNVAAETGRTPAQLAAERAELVGAASKVMQQHFDDAKRCNFSGCGCEICELFRPILAKVKK